MPKKLWLFTICIVIINTWVVGGFIFLLLVRLHWRGPHLGAVPSGPVTLGDAVLPGLPGSLAGWHCGPGQQVACIALDVWGCRQGFIIILLSHVKDEWLEANTMMVVFVLWGKYIHSGMVHLYDGEAHITGVILLQVLWGFMGFYEALGQFQEWVWSWWLRWVEQECGVRWLWGCTCYD